MIDEYWTWIFYGYHSDELSRRSGKPIVVMCDDCCQYRVSCKDSYRDLCGSCAKLVKYVSDESRRNKSEAHKGILHTAETKMKLSKIVTGRKASDEARENMSIAQTIRHQAFPRTYETRRKHSAALQGISYEDWDGFVSNGAYCELFDEACKERIRAKYNHRCVVCDKHQDENITKNGKQIALSVHHLDMNKDQGCNGNEWKLIPLCLHCHGKSHFEPLKSRIIFVLDNVPE